MNKEDVIALYLRLSEEDEGENLDESNSITSQRSIIKDYIKRKEDLLKCRITEFCDDGYSGTNFSRPSVSNLLNQVKAGEIQCIIVKDFSRFGRNYIEVGNYLEQVFPFIGVRFISVNDGYDSEKNSACSEFIGVAFKNLVYDLYSKDLSQKIVSVRHSKAQQGNFITAYAPYGYLKSEHQQLKVDEEAASIVKRIFNMAQNGVAMVEIARTLNREQIPTPLMLRKSRKQQFPCHPINEKSIWKTSVISKILKDQRYMGDAVFGKVTPIHVGSRKDTPVNPKDWIVVPNTHEPIITKEVFEEVNANFKKYESRQKGEYPLAGKVRCGSCNYAISPKVRGGKKVVLYQCNTPNLTDEFSCYRQNIGALELEEGVLNILNRFTAIAGDFEMMQLQQINWREEFSRVEKSIGNHEGFVRRLKTARLKDYEAYQRGILSKETFTEQKKNYDTKISEMTHFLKEENLKLCDIKKNVERKERIFSKDRKRNAFDRLTAEIVNILIDTIYIQEDGSLKVQWNFRDVFEGITSASRKEQF